MLYQYALNEYIYMCWHSWRISQKRLYLISFLHHVNSPLGSHSIPTGPSFQDSNFPSVFWESAYHSSFSSCIPTVFLKIINKSHANTSLPKDRKLTDLICTDISKNQHKSLTREFEIPNTQICIVWCAFAPRISSGRPIGEKQRNLRMEIND